ncbi:MAG: hypothetical protein ABEK42_09215, partial [Thiohalorhabdaceae bacterium]
MDQQPLGRGMTGREQGDPAGRGSGSLLGPEADQEFLACWNRLETLDEADWQRFYTLLLRLLGRYSFPELGPSGANMALEEAVQDFLVTKVYYRYCYQPGTKPELDHPGAIVPWFRRMLLDRYRTRTSGGEQTLHGKSLDEPLAGADGEGAGERGDRLANPGATDPAKATADGEIRQWAESLRP